MSDAHRARWRREIADENAWESETPRRLVDLVAAVAVAAAVLDAVLTYFLLDGSVHLERNPVIEAAMRAFGIAPTLTVGAVLRFGIVLAIAAIASRAIRPAVRYAAAVTLGVITLWWCLVVFANAAVVARPWLAG
jgi:hypothetical protein